MNKEIPEEIFNLWEEIWELKKSAYEKDKQLRNELKENGLTINDLVWKKYPKIAKEVEEIHALNELNEKEKIK